MRKCVFLWFALGLLASVPAARATIFGSIRGVVHDPQHRPVAVADVKLQSATSDFSLVTQTDQNGEFAFNPVAVGDYSITVERQGFAGAKENVTVVAESSPVLHFQLEIAPLSQTEVVTAAAEVANVDSVTPTTLVDRRDIAQHSRRRSDQQPCDDYRLHSRRLPHARHAAHAGRPPDYLADRWRSHSQYEYRHQPCPADRSERHRLRRGSARQLRRRSTETAPTEMFNVLPKLRIRKEQRRRDRDHLRQLLPDQRSAQLRRAHRAVRLLCERQRQPQQSGPRNARFPQVYHDAENGYGGFTSLLYNLDPKDQFRFDGQLRQDYYQIPYDPDPNDFENSTIRQPCPARRAARNRRLRALFVDSHFQPRMRS